VEFVAAAAQQTAPSPVFVFHPVFLDGSWSVWSIGRERNILSKQGLGWVQRFWPGSGGWARALTGEGLHCRVTAEEG